MSIKTSITDISEYKVEFKISRFIRLFMYHLLFFIIGPFVTVFIGIFDSFQLARNTAFSPLSKQRRIFILQLLQWVFVVYISISVYLDYSGILPGLV